MSGPAPSDIIDQLDFSEKTAKRVRWEAWSLRIIAPHKVEVTNESYGIEKHDHQYVVTVTERNGHFVPVKCECPADEYNDDHACKHRVAVATKGGPLVLGAAMAYAPNETEPTIRADGGNRTTRQNPANALNGARTGHICDRCNKGVRTGDLVRAYATHYPEDGWVLRRMWCQDCGESVIKQGTDGADEVLIEAVFWDNCLVSVETKDRSHPVEGGDE